MDEIPRPLWNRVGDDVDVPRLELRAAVVLEPARVEVEREHATRRSDLPSHPPRDRASTRTDLEATATRAETCACEMCDRQVVERALEASEPIDRRGIGVREQVLGLTHGTSPLSRTHRLGEPTLG